MSIWKIYTNLNRKLLYNANYLNEFQLPSVPDLPELEPFAGTWGSTKLNTIQIITESSLKFEFRFKMKFIPNAPIWGNICPSAPKPKKKLPNPLAEFFAVSFLWKTPRGRLIVGNLAIEKGLFLGNKQAYYTILCCGPKSWVPTYSSAFFITNRSHTLQFAHQSICRKSKSTKLSPLDPCDPWILSRPATNCLVQMDFQGNPFKTQP